MGFDCINFWSLTSYLLVFICTLVNSHPHFYTTGIVKFEVGYNVSYTGSSEFRDFVRVPGEYFHQEKMYISEPLLDGMQLQFHIRAFDIMDKYLDDFVNVKFDVSPPTIKDLWLTKGDRVNITVHNLQELNEIT